MKNNLKSSQRSKILKEIEKDLTWKKRVGKNYKDKPDWYLLLRHPDLKTTIATLFFIFSIGFSIICWIFSW